MRMNQRELLTSGPDGDGIVHAFYATATRTLCNKPKPPTVKGWPVIPTCDACFTAARAFHKIDGSCPKNWHGLALGEVAVVERLGPDAAATSSSTPPRWSREAVIEALQRYAAMHGGLPPRSADWALYAADRPSRDNVRTVFGSWADAVEAAGFPRPRPGAHPSVLAGLSGRTGEAGPSPAETESRGLARMAPGKTPVRTESVVALPDPGGASSDRVARAVLAAGRAFVETLERELLEALESEAA